jgi:hypothetical protein
VPVQASQFGYSPAVLPVHQGDQATIELLSTDLVHGLARDDYPLQATSDPGDAVRRIDLYHLARLRPLLVRRWPQLLLRAIRVYITEPEAQIRIPQAVNPTATFVRLHLGHRNAAFHQIKLLQGIQDAPA